MKWVLIMVLYSYSSGEVGTSSYRPSTMSTDTTVIEFNSEQACQMARTAILNKFKLPRQDRMDTGVRVSAECFKK